jgi:acyl-CoA synthetase (AMP-forming)/AMP-acid ligase II
MGRRIPVIIDNNSSLLHMDLTKAWSNKKSFALISSKIPIDRDILRDTLAVLPETYSENHFILTTSGSTGNAKLLIGLKDRAEALASVINKVQGNSSACETVQILPLSYSFCFVNQWLWARVHNKPIHFTSGLKDITGLKYKLKESKEAMICMVGSQAFPIIAAFNRDVFPKISHVHFAGGRFPEESTEQMRKLFPNASISNNYGCAEAMPRLTHRSVDLSNDASNVGVPLPGVEIRVNTQFEIEFCSRYQVVAYCNPPNDWVSVREDSWLKTGDLGTINADKSLNLMGRHEEVFKRHGEKVSLYQLHNFIAPLLTCEFCTYRLKDRHGEDGYALVVKEPFARHCLQQLLSKYRKLSRAYWPVQIEASQEIPTLASGKKDVVSLKKSTNKSIIWSQMGKY